MEIEPLVSVVITTKNSAATLEALLASCQRQTFRQFEVIVVDNFSNDATCEIARRYTDHVFLKGPERSAQRNFGVAEAKGTYVLILDSDMELTPSVVEECVERVSLDPTTKGLIIPEESFGDGFWAQCKALERSCYVGDGSIEAARFFERDAFLDVGGYDHALWGGEDWDLSIRFRSRFPITRIQTLIKHNEGRLSLWQAMHKKAYYAQSFRRYAEKHPGHALRQANFPLRAAYFRNWRRLAQSPHLLLGMLFLRLCEMAAAAVGLLFAYIQKPKQTSNAS